jgi:hypothetical protein
VKHGHTNQFLLVGQTDRQTFEAVEEKEEERETGGGGGKVAMTFVRR